MSYWDKWDDRNREAHSEGRRDGERGYGYDWELESDYLSERGEAYRDGIGEGERQRESREEERREEEAEERRVYERQREQRIEYEQEEARREEEA